MKSPTEQLTDLFSSFKEVYGRMERSPKAGRPTGREQRDIQRREIRQDRAWD